MRILALLLILLSAPALAEDVTLTSRVSAVTVYPKGATVTREAAFDLPEGRHRLTVTDLPRETPLASVRVTVEGATLGSVTTRTEAVPPSDAQERPEVAAARAEVARLEAALRSAEAGVADIRLEAEAARARLRFLDGLARREGLAAQDPAALGDVVAMIGRETLAARQAEAGAERRAQAAERDLEELREDLADARATLAALVPETGPRALLVVAVEAAAPTEGRLHLSYTVSGAGWTPLYDLHLSRAEGRVRIDRGAYLHQRTGESWRDVALTLATRRPSGQGAPGELDPWIPRLADPDEVLPALRATGEAGVADMAPPQAEEAMQARAAYDGLSVRYDYPEPVSVATGADRVRLMLPPVEAAARIAARAVPMLDDSAFLVARITTPEDTVLLPTGEARFYLDGRYTGRRPLPMVPGGAEATLSFGPIEGLALRRVVRTRAEGERGLITRGTERRETAEITVENLTGAAWPVELRDRVPVSENDALRISWTAAPPPDETDAGDARGILGWRFELPAGESRTITLDTEMSWPEGKVLR